MYIFAQIIGAMVAGLVLMGQYHEQFVAFEARLGAVGLPMIGAKSPASILAPFPAAEQTNLGWLFFIEWFVDSFLVSPCF